jgi:ketosteroid isomerase-like protein
MRNEANPCRCAKKTQAFMKAGYVDPKNFLFAQEALSQLETMDAAYAELHRANPFQAGPDFVAALRGVIGGAMVVVLACLASACTSAPSDKDNFSPEAIIALEKGALDRWAKGDPGGYYDIVAADTNYFDPLADKRIDGLGALKSHIEPFAGKFSIDRVEMINPHVRRDGDLAVLTFNLNDYGAQMNGGPKETARWNSTEVYQRISGAWRIVHSHWSYTKPDIKPKP